MRVLLIHSDFIEVIPKEKALKEADEKVEKIKEEEALVVFTAVEEGDGEEVLKDVENEVIELSKKLNVRRIVLYPYVHLTNTPSSPKKAKELLQKLEERLRKSFEVKRAAFGWYKAFNLKAKGHPLSELSRVFKGEQESISKSLKAEEKLKSKFFVFWKGELREVEEFLKEGKGSESLRKLISYETKKVRSYEKEPPHIKLMRELEWVDYEEGSDSGNFRFYPKGRMVKKLLERFITEMCIDYGAFEVETPLMYDFEHPALEKYLNRFPARQYIVLSDKKKFFLRFAACFGQFLMAKDSVITYKNLPLKLYELTRYSFRREQSGELAGLKRLRAFTMPDMHTIVKDEEMAKEEFKNQLRKSIEFLKAVDLLESCEVAFRAQKDFFEKNKEWYNELLEIVGKPILIEIFEERYAYFITKFEFNFIDFHGKASALSTVQIDVENSKTYGIDFIDEKGEKRKPLILHASFSGSIERVIYALLEKQAIRIAKGEKAILPSWLAPIQIRFIPLSPNHLEKTLEITKGLEKRRVRFDIDDREESLSKKVRRAQKEWIPYIVVIGDKESKESLSVDVRGEGRKNLSLEELIEEVENKNIVFEKLNMPSLISKRPVFRSRL